VGGASATLLSVEKGPCEFCHQVIPLAQLIRHEVNTQRNFSFVSFISLLLTIAGEMQIHSAKAKLGPIHFLPVQPRPSPFLANATPGEVCYHGSCSSDCWQKKLGHKIPRKR
jgi:hypothetical protein